MLSMKLVILVSLFVHQCLIILAQLSNDKQEVHAGTQFSVVVKRNQTGHQITQYLLNKATAESTKNWKADFLQSSSYIGGVHNTRIIGTITVPPQRSEEYELFYGIGYYKFHLTKASFADASSICQKEGAHLAIVNSDAEASALKTFFAKTKTSGYAWVGIHDPEMNRNFRTIFGKPLNETGYAKWLSGQPDGPDNQFCVYFNPNGLLGDNPCTSVDPFFCEHDLSWDEI